MHASPPHHASELHQRLDAMHLNGPNVSRARQDGVEIVTLDDGDSGPTDMEPTGARAHYEGYLLQKGQPPAGENKTWRTVRKERLPLSSDELAKEVQDLQRRGISVTDRHMELKPNQRQQVTHVVKDQNQNEPDRRAKWTLAAIKLKQIKASTFSPVETLSISVILQRTIMEGPAPMGGAGGGGGRMPGMEKAPLPPHGVPPPRSSQSHQAQDFGGPAHMGQGPQPMPKHAGMPGMPQNNAMPSFAHGPGGPAMQGRDNIHMHGAAGMKPQGVPEMMPGMKPQGMPEMMPGMKPQGMPEMMPGMMPGMKAPGMPEMMPGMKAQGMPEMMSGMKPQGMHGMMPGHGASQFGGPAGPHGASMGNAGPVPGMHGGARNEPHNTVPVAPPGAFKAPGKQFQSQVPPVPPPAPTFPGLAQQMPPTNKMTGAPHPGAFHDQPSKHQHMPGAPHLGAHPGAFHDHQPSKHQQMSGGIGIGIGLGRKGSTHRTKAQPHPDIMMVPSDSECSTDDDRWRDSDEDTSESGRTKATSVWSGPNSPVSARATVGSTSTGTIKPSVHRRHSVQTAKHAGGGRRLSPSRYRHRESKGSLSSFDEEDPRYYHRRHESVEEEARSRRNSHVDRAMREKMREEAVRREEQLLDKKVADALERRIRQEGNRRLREDIHREEEDRLRERERATRRHDAPLRFDLGATDDYIPSEDVLRRRASLRRQANLGRGAAIPPPEDEEDSAELYRRLRRTATAPQYDEHLQGRGPGRGRRFFEGWS